MCRFLCPLHSRWIRSVVICAEWLLVAAGCGAWTGCNARPSQITSEQKPATLVISADTAGWIVPCGCTANQSGGLARRHTLIDRLTADHGVLVFDAGGAAQGTALYDRLKFEAILRGELAMGLKAHNLGASEVQLGPDYLRQLPNDLRGILLSANTVDDAKQPLFPGVQVFQIEGQRLAVIGVVAESFATPAVEVLPPRQAVLDALATVQGHYDRALVLAYLPESELRELAAALPEVDLVVGGPTGQSIPPQMVGPVMMAAATNKGKFVAVLDMPSSPGERWAGRIVDVSADLPEHEAQKKNMASFYAGLASRELTPAETSFGVKLPANTPAGFQIAGSETCLQCHEKDCRDGGHTVTDPQDWSESNHRHAWDTLVAKQSQVDSYCQQCHTTGYGLPGGFVKLSATPNRVGVGCESCHGPSWEHVQTQGRNTTAYAHQAKWRCTTCHDHENSPTFDYHRYWAALVTGDTPAPDSASASQP